MKRLARLRRLSLTCLLLAALAFVLQPLAHAEHRLMMALPGLCDAATGHEQAEHGGDHAAHDHASSHAHHDHASHDATPMPICCDCTCGKLSEANAAPPPGVPPALAAAHLRPSIGFDLSVDVTETPFLRPLKHGPPLA